MKFFFMENNEVYLVRLYSQLEELKKDWRENRNVYSEGWLCELSKFLSSVVHEIRRVEKRMGK